MNIEMPATKVEILRFTNLEHEKTEALEEGSYELILKGNFDQELKSTYNISNNDDIWISVHCSSPGSYFYSFDGINKDLSEEEFSLEEEESIDYFLSKTNLILEEAENLDIEPDDETIYHWGLDKI
ncbi:hypothetical protein MZM54_02090 [[Brevibacterium] frigoritolerans]|nr:hypothetical protein [Peribacillus frigoritolerans]